MEDEVLASRISIRPSGRTRRELRTYIRNNQYIAIVLDDQSRFEIPVGQELKDEYGLGYHERLCSEVRGNPKWNGKPGRLELEYD